MSLMSQMCMMMMTMTTTTTTTMMMMVMTMMMIVRMKGEMQISAEASLADVTHGSAHLNLSNHPLPWSPGDEEYDHD